MRMVLAVVAVLFFAGIASAIEPEPQNKFGWQPGRFGVGSGRFGDVDWMRNNKPDRPPMPDFRGPGGPRGQFRYGPKVSHHGHSDGRKEWQHKGYKHHHKAPKREKSEGNCKCCKKCCGKMK